MPQWLADIYSDLRFAWRGFIKRSGFTAVAAITLALGIAGATSVFSIVYAVLLRPLPRRNSRTLEDVAAATWATRTGRVLTRFGPAKEVLTIPASASFFQALGVTAAIGRTFNREDEGHGCSIVVAHQFWTSTLGADRSVAGKGLTLDHRNCTVLGVMPARFGFYPSQTQAWVLLGPDYQPDQGDLLTGIFARLKTGVTPAQAQAELGSIYRAIQHDRETQDFEPVVYGLQGEFTFLAGKNLRTTLVLVFAAVLLLLLIACLAAFGMVRYFRLANPIELSVGADV